MQLDLLHSMVRHPDHETSVAAAVEVAPEVERLREQLYQIIAIRGPITALELEELPQYLHLGPSTVRKRVSELFLAGRLRVHDRRTVMLKDNRTGRAMSFVVNEP